ncbi:MAG: type III secretion system chaperone [Chlamydiota bacterium]
MVNLNEFMKQLSYEMELEQPLAAQMSGVYTLPLDENLYIVISTGDEGLSFTSDVCKCPTVKREEFLTKMMHANLFGQGTSEAILGLTKNGEKITLSRHVHHEIDYKEFSEILEDFINTVDYWADEVRVFK